MKKVLVWTLAVVLVLSMAIPAAAAPGEAHSSPAAKPENLEPVLTEESYVVVELHSTEDVLELHEDVQVVMQEAKEQLADAAPEGHAVKYFFYVEIVGDQQESVSVDFETFVESASAENSNAFDVEDVKQGRVVFMQFVDGEWVELDYVINEDGTITVFNVVEGPFAVFMK